MDLIDPRSALQAAIRARGETFAGLSRMLGRNAAWLQQYVKRGTPRVLPERERRLLAEYLCIDEVALGAPRKAQSAGLGIRRLDVRAAAGVGGLAEDDDPLGETLLDARMIAALGVDPAALSLIRAQGDSMEPLIHDGDQMLIDRSDRAVPPRGGIYVIRLDGVLMVKRLRRTPDGMEIVSDNAAYAPVFARPELIGRVVWLARALR